MEPPLTPPLNGAAEPPASPAVGDGGAALALAGEPLGDAADIDSLIASRRAQLESLRARNRAMMESLVSSAPRFAEDSELRSSLDELRSATAPSPSKHDGNGAASDELARARDRIRALEADLARARGGGGAAAPALLERQYLHAFMRQGEATAKELALLRADCRRADSTFFKFKVVFVLWTVVLALVASGAGLSTFLPPRPAPPAARAGTSRAPRRTRRAPARRSRARRRP